MSFLLIFLVSIPFAFVGLVLMIISDLIKMIASLFFIPMHSSTNDFVEFMVKDMKIDKKSIDKVIKR